MNILVLGSLYLVNALQQAGHRTVSVGTTGIAAGGHDIGLSHPVLVKTLWQKLADSSFEPDVVLMSDEGNLPFALGLEELPVPLIFYSIDTYCNPWHIPFAYAFDKTLVAQKDVVPLFVGEGHNAEWFPLFCQSLAQSQGVEEWLAARDIPAIFVGTPNPKNIPQRQPFLEKLSAMQALEYRSGEYFSLFTRARMVLNQTAVGEMNFRCFEAMGCGAALLHDSSMYGFTDLFQEGLNVLPHYERLNPDSAARAIRFWNQRPEKLAELALRGLEQVSWQHTAEVRAATFIQMAEDLLARQAWQERLGNLQHRKHMLSTAYGTLAVELPPEMGAHKELYAQLAVGCRASQ